MSSSALIRERQQEELLNALRHARGGEVTYDELRNAGIEFPAVIVSELQAAGIPVERRYSAGRAQPSFRLAGAPGASLVEAPAAVDDSPTQAFDPAAVDGSPTQAFDPVPEGRPMHLDRRQGWLTPSRLLGGGALLAAAVIVTVLVLNSLGGGGQAGRVRTAAGPVHRAGSRHDQRLQAIDRSTISGHDPPHYRLRGSPRPPHLSPRPRPPHLSPPPSSRHRGTSCLTRTSMRALFPCSNRPYGRRARPPAPAPNPPPRTA